MDGFRCSLRFDYSKEKNKWDKFELGHNLDQNPNIIMNED